MPTYQYACTACGHQLEAVQSFTDNALTECPNCAGQLRKVFSAVGIVFKGSGFYRTDSRKGDVPPGSSNGSKETKDSKPASSSDSSSSSSDSSGSSSTTSSSTTSSSTSGSSSSSSSSGSSSGGSSSSTPAKTASSAA